VEKLSVVTRANLVDWGGVEINKDRTRDIFSGSGLCKDGIELATIVKVLRIRIGATIFRKAVLEKVAGGKISVRMRGGKERSTYSSQALLPSWVPAWPIWR